MSSPSPAPLGADHHPTLIQAGWDPAWSEQLMRLADPHLEPARVLREERTAWLLLAADGVLSGGASGRLLHGADLRPAVGDWVAASRADGQARIHAVLPRRTCLARRAAGTSGAEQVIAANVDTVFVVAGLDRDFNPRRIERYLALVLDGGATPVVVLNKTDLHPDAGTFVDRIVAIAPGIPVLAVSAATGAGLDALRRHLRPGRTVALLGSSGAGKSSLANRLLGSDRLRTGPVRADDQRGRHTTTARELLPLPDGGGVLLDTPGMRELHLAVEEDALAAVFDDIAALAGQCRFADCAHAGEPGCAIAAAVADGRLPATRLAAWDKLRRERESDRLRHGEGGQAELRARDRRFGRMVRRAVQAKRRLRGDEA